MATATIPIPVFMEFEQDTDKIFKEVRHYDLIKGKDLFSQRLNISNNRGHSRAKYTYCLKTWKGKKWSKQLTGLFPTNRPDLFYGDTEDKKNLVIVKFVESGKVLRLYYFENFYTRRLTAFLKTFNEHY